MKRRRFLGCLAWFVLPGLVAGCHVTGPRSSESAVEEKPEKSFWNEWWRPPTKKRESFFFNEKSRQIEEDLGL